MSIAKNSIALPNLTSLIALGRGFIVSVKKLLLRPDEVAHQLSLSRSKVYELVKDGRLCAWRPNGCKKKPVRITAESLEEFYNSQLVGIIEK